MNCVILQPSYIPWRGYFHQIQKADVFVFGDDVQYETAGWRNRNRVKTATGGQWLTIPVHSKGSHTQQRLIKDIEICRDKPWKPWEASHLSVIRTAYKTAPYFQQYFPLLQELYSRPATLLSDFTIDLTIALARQLGISGTRFVRSSTLGGQGGKTDRIVQIMNELGADHYVSGPAAKEYIEYQKLDAAGITIEWMEYDYPEYPQLHGGFDPHVSVLDLLFMLGPEAPAFIWGETQAENIPQWQETTEIRR